MRAVAEHQALVVQVAQGAGKSDLAGEGAGVRENLACQRRQRQDGGMFTENEGQHNPLQPQIGGDQARAPPSASRRACNAS